MNGFGDPVNQLKSKLNSLLFSEWGPYLRPGIWGTVNDLPGIIAESQLHYRRINARIETAPPAMCGLQASVAHYQQETSHAVAVAARTIAPNRGAVTKQRERDAQSANFADNLR